MLFLLLLLSALLLLLLHLYCIPDWLIYLLKRWEPRITWDCDIPTRIALTIDDVPYLGNKWRPRRADQTTLPQILQVLRKHRVKATLFVKTHPDALAWHADLLRKAVAEGHQLANRGEVVERSAGLTPAEFQRKFLACEAAIRELHFDNPRRGQRWFRPGAGAWNGEMLDFIERVGVRTVLGSAYSALEPFTSNHASFSLFTYCYLRWRARPGKIVVLHDRQETPVILDRLLTAWGDEGYEVGLL